MPAKSTGSAPPAAIAFVPQEQLDRAQLPQPHIAGKQEWLATHDLAWDLAFRHIGHDQKLPQPWYMDEACMPDRLWQWDTCFMSLYTGYAPRLFPGIQSLDNFYGWQREDGFIAMCTLTADGQPAYGERINPPLMAWAEWEYFRLTGDDSRLAGVLPILVRYFDWIQGNRRRDPIVVPHLEGDSAQAEGGGLYWETCAGAMGMDNSPRCTHLAWTGGEIAWIDLSSQQALSALYLARIAAHLGQSDLEQRFAAEHRTISALINRWMWCARDQFYHDIFLDGNYLSCKTVASFWPLLSRVASENQAQALVSHLRNPNEFWRLHPVPSLSFDDPNYIDSGAYWMGGVWAPTNYMIVRGLLEYGLDATAHEIACKHLEAMTQVRLSHQPQTIWEAYAPEAIAPCTAKDKRTFAKPDFCGWSALGATSMLYENVIGLRVDAPAGRIVWDVRSPQEHGIKRYPLGAQRLELSCAAASGSEPRPLRIDTPVAFTLETRCRGQVLVQQLAAGRHELRI